MKLKRYIVGSIQTNCYLFVDDEVDANGKRAGAIVDPGDYSKEMSDEIKRSNLDMKYILLTHGHGDHILGISKFLQDFPEMKLVASEDEMYLLDGAGNNYSSDISGKDVRLTPDIFVKDGDTISLGSLGIFVIATPGHTKGGVCYLVDKVLFSGDTLFRDSIGRTDLEGGSFPQLISSIKDKLMSLDDDIEVLPGHMASTTIGHERRYNPYI
jgi:glyoxylase-like metal-dependent hydrolase (beta-lactamase superfamily II)